MVSDTGATGIFVTIFVVGILVNTALSFAVGSAAQKKGRSFGAFWAISFFVSFVLAAIIVAAIAPAPRQIEQKLTRDCPFCAEEIAPQATICKHCGKHVDPVRIDEDGKVVETFLTFDEWLRKFIAKPDQAPELIPVTKEAKISKIDEHLVWTQLQDGEGPYLLNGFYSKLYSEAVQGWYCADKEWQRGSKFVIEIRK